MEEDIAQVINYLDRVSSLINGILQKKRPTHFAINVKLLSRAFQPLFPSRSSLNAP